jgi:hypothetical protein
MQSVFRSVKQVSYIKHGLLVSACYRYHYQTCTWISKAYFLMFVIMMVISLSLDGCLLFSHIVCVFQTSSFFRYSHQNLVFIFLCSQAYYMPYSYLPHWLNHSNIIHEENKLRRSLLSGFLKPPVTSSLLGLNILINTLFSNTLSLYCFLNVHHHVGCLQMFIQY